MPSNRISLPYWSRALATDLVGDLKISELNDAKGDAVPDAHVDAEAWRDELADRSLKESDLQLTIVQAWRRAHDDLVTASRLLSPEVCDDHLQAILQHFGAKDLLLEQLTDEMEDGEAAVRWLVENVADRSVQNELREILSGWFRDDVAPDTSECSDDRVVRIVIFGGHVRDEKKMNERLFRDSPFDVHWKPFEKGGTSQTIRAVSEAITSADAVLLITSMVSHTLMGIVKRQSKTNDIPFRAIPKATDIHLTTVLSELFPGLHVENWR